MIEQVSIFELLDSENWFTAEIKTGSGFEGGRVRIYCASCKLGVDDLAAFMRKEYGTGGHSITFPDGTHGFSDYDSSGITIRKWKTNVTEKHTWKEAAKEVKRLIFSGEYLTDKDFTEVQKIAEKQGSLPMPYPRLKVTA